MLERRSPWSPGKTAPVVLALIAFSFLAFALPARAAFPGEAGKIAWASNRSGNFDIWVMNGDGSAKTQLTTDPASDYDPTWSASGAKIAFVSSRDGNFEIYTMNADGTGQSRITNNSAHDADPTWSPDGTQIAFASNRDGNFEIYKVNADGTGATRLTNTGAGNGFPSWSPDGTKIAFATDRDGDHEIYKMNPDGSGQTNLTNYPAAEDENPNWTADGRQIGFDANRATSDHDIWKMNADGSGQVAVFTQAISQDLFPAPIPSGGDNGVAQSNATGNDEIWRLNPFVNLSNDPGADQTPDWQPVVTSYPRPRGATPYHISLVPAFKQCTSPNATHAAPISTGSCDPVQQASSYLTVGTPDFNGQKANSLGSVQLKVIPDDTGTPQDESDGAVTVSETDVRCQGTSGGCSGALTDYVGDVLLDVAAQITDRNSGGAVSATTQSYPVRASVPCATTISTSIGSTCSLSSSLNVILGPGAVLRQKRAVWELTQVRLQDGGADGNEVTLADNTVFATGGVFFP
jgi:Tol biopolymer transport system component